MDDGGKRFVYFMYAQNNKQQQQIKNNMEKPLLCVIHVEVVWTKLRAYTHTQHNTEENREKKIKKKQKIIPSWAERNHIYILYVRIRFAISLTHDQIHKPYRKSTKWRNHDCDIASTPNNRMREVRPSYPVWTSGASDCEHIVAYPTSQQIILSTVRKWERERELTYEQQWHITMPKWHI